MERYLNDQVENFKVEVQNPATSIYFDVFLFYESQNEKVYNGFDEAFCTHHKSGTGDLLMLFDALAVCKCVQWENLRASRPAQEKRDTWSGAGV